jgi:hypothetical protein
VRPPFRVPPSDASPDLDMRPGEPARSSLRRWVQTCDFCEACAPDLSKLTRASKVTLGTPMYFSVRGPRAAIPFVRWSMLCKPEDRAEALLQAAWAADDAGDKAAAQALRRQAAAVWPTPMPVASALRLVDVLRRAGDFADAAAQAAALDGVALDDTATPILAYQRRLIAAGDAERHLLSAALPPPAHSPHVAHKQAAQAPRGKGLWAWFRRG